MSELQITRIRRSQGKPWVYAELHRGDQLVISATLEFILGELSGPRSKDELEARSAEERPYCIHCRCQMEAR